MSLRRTPAADPRAAARIWALLGGDGWVPPTRAPSPGQAEPDPTGEEPAGHAPGEPAEHAPAEPVGPEPAAQAPVGEGLLDRWRGARLDPGRRGVAALGLLAVLAAGLSGTVWLRSRPSEVTAPRVSVAGVPVPGSSAAASHPTAARGTARPEGPSSAAEIVVSVAGKVVVPGLVRLPAGSRLDDALRAAGGVLPGTDLSAVNAARRLVDGEQVLVGVPQPGAAPAAPGAPAAAGPVDLNAATAAQLDALPGIGPVLAQRIVDWRTEHGRFGSVDQLREVGGIGESKFGLLKSKVTV